MLRSTATAPSKMGTWPSHESWSVGAQARGECSAPPAASWQTRIVTERLEQSRPFYEDFGWAYDLLVGDPVEPWVDCVCEALRAHRVGQPASILDAGGGTGRHAGLLTRRGHDVTLVDASGALVEQAERRVPKVFQADLRRLALRSRFDVVLSRGVLNDLVQDENRDAALGSFAAHLRVGGLLVLDVREREASARRYGNGRTLEKTVSTHRGELRFVSRGLMKGSLIHIQERHELSGAGGSRSCASHEFMMRPWSRGELSDRLGAAGFAAIDVLPSPTRESDDRLLVTALRPS